MAPKNPLKPIAQLSGAVAFALSLIAAGTSAVLAFSGNPLGSIPSLEFPKENANRAFEAEKKLPGLSEQKRFSLKFPRLKNGVDATQNPE